MFAFGMAGFLAGVLFEKGILSKERIPLSIYGGLSVLLIVGPLLDTCSVFTMTSVLSASGAALIYLSGLPVNAVHAAATFITLLLGVKTHARKAGARQAKVRFAGGVRNEI